MINVGTLQGVLVLQDDFSRGLDLAKGKVGAFTKEVNALFGVASTGIGVFTGAVVAGTTALVALGQRGAVVGDVRAAFQSLSGSVKESNDILDALRQGVQGTVSDYELMAAANRAMGA